MKPVILVVDDEAHIREMLALLLGLHGFSVTEAEDGREAWQKMAEDRPDVVILDVMMPEMDGLTLCRKVRATPEMASVPIIMLSGKTHLGAEEEGLAAGANFYMWKPMKTPELLANIQSVLLDVPVTA